MRYLLPILLLCGCASIPKTMGEVAPYDVKSAESFLYYNIRYLRDSKPEDEWRPCDKTLERGEGDCEDYALCGQELTKRWDGCDSRIIIYYPIWANSRAHAVNWIKCDNGLKGYFQNSQWVAGLAPMDDEKLDYNLVRR